MEISLISTTLDQIETECLVVGVSEDHSVVASSTELDKLTSDLIDSGDFKAKPGSQIILRNPPGLCAKRLILVGLGNLKTFDALAQNDAFVSLGKALKGLPITQTTLDTESLTRGDQGTLERLGYGLVWAAYEYTTTKPKPVDDDAKLLTHVALVGSEADQAHLTTGMAIGHGANLTRELGNLPGNTCTPRYLADQAVHLADRFSKLSCEVFDEDALEEIGMYCMLSVSRGSEEPARFIVLNYQGAIDPDSKPKVLVGKGVTFDTGGISLKPSAAMEEMKFDMCGAATVMGCMQSICEIGLEANVIGVIGAVENMPSGSATKPGDVVKTLAGKTVEILNTDAEGRLVLCDALTYVERFNPEAVVDIATLTGACLVALGRHNTGLLSTDDQLADELYTIGQKTGDPCWRLPIEAPYQKLLDSNFADIANIGGRDAGTITAACFLSRFTENYRWAHLDIAGTAWFSGGKAKGASGRPVPLLVNWLRA